ncbi:expressed unknown protein [Seminavis robusta]|uniref:Uncharacterized protein n=1 Tax=Seminavis robusta TaxID=568900 RepID=A0A9N8E245_9STRA|nr:expressed unknown protein [Seminavis robusta]|eukprot:Sro468_g149050.1 n/a (442) ;mRNA; f:6579-7904
MATVEDRDRLLSSNNAVSASSSSSSSSSITELDLALKSDSNFRHTTEALHAKGSSTIRHVTVTCHGSFFMWRWSSSPRTAEEERQIREFFQALGSLVNLQSLSFVAASFGNPVTVPTELLVETLQRSIRLERLRVHGLCLNLDKDAAQRGKTLESLELALLQDSKLSEISFFNSFFGSQWLTASTISSRQQHPQLAFERLLSVCTTRLPQLEQLCIRHRRHRVREYPGTRLSKSVIQQVAASHSLRQLELFNFKLFDEHWEALAEGIWLAGTYSRLHELSISCKSFGLRACRAVADILTTSTSLQSLYLEPDKGTYSCGKHLNAECTNVLANGLLESNSSLQSFTLQGMPVVSLEAFVKMIQVNLTLETLDVTGYQSNSLLEQDLETHLKLNQVGRYALVHDESRTASRAQWANAIIAVEGNVHCLFYLLSANPSLCNPFS